MNLRDLDYFTAVAELGHFGRAADRCCVTQPTLSGQLRRLEETLGHPLFERTTRRVTLTDFGTEILSLAQRVRSDCDSIIRTARAMDDPFSGQISLGAFPTLGPWLLPRITPALKAAFPLTRFSLREDKSPLLQQQLETQALDAALLSLPQPSGQIESIPLFSEPFFAAVSESHPWAERGSIHPDELAGQNLLLLEDGHCLRDQALEVCHLETAAAHSEFEGTSLETLRQMVRLDEGITLVPQLAVPATHESGIRYIPLTADSARREIALCFRHTHPRREFFLALADRINSLCNETARKASPATNTY